MSIPVTCPSCLTRFNVGDQHAGKTGPCPKCKKPILIPEVGEEIVIHAPELEPGAKNAAGKNTLKPIRRKEAKFSLNVTAVTAGLVALSVAIAWLLGQTELGDNQFWALAGGAIVLGPMLAYAAYTFLRDDELGIYQGSSVIVRSISCGLVYALLWGVYVYLGTNLFGDEAFAEKLEMVQIAGLCVPLLGIGAFAALVCFDFDFITGFFHYTLYFGVTILLRFVMGLPFLPGM